LSSIAYRNRNRAWEFADNLLWVVGRHIAKFGAGALIPFVCLDYHYADGGLVEYADLATFLADQPADFFSTVSRQAYAAGRLSPPPSTGHYTHAQFDVFAEDSFRITPRLTVNAGVRIDHFAPPRLRGDSVPQVVLGAGPDVQSRIAAATLQFAGAGHGQLYQAPNPNVAARAGFAFNPRGRDDLVLRGGYGVFFDRPFDNIWLDVQSNAWVLGHADLSGRFDPRAGVQALFPAAGYSNFDLRNDFSNLTLLQPGLRTAYAQSFFLSLQHRLPQRFYFEANALGSLGRQLVTNDIVNRRFSDPTQFAAQGNPFAQLNGTLPQLQYRANQGSSNYSALSLVVRRSTRRTLLQAAYTWSHSIDNQSEPLTGDYTDLRLGSQAPQYAAFPLQFHSGMDRGNSDFDQRHNVVFYAAWTTGPGAFGSRLFRLVRDWQFSALGSLRSGLPYSVTSDTLFSPILAIARCIGANVALTPGCSGEVLNGRANLLSPAMTSDTPIPGGRVLLQSSAFGPSSPNVSGNTARNAFTGPGAAHLDVSLGRSFPLRARGEAARFEIRADAYNVLNHANLGQPNGNLNSGSFGAAYYGLPQQRSGLIPVLPLRESPRQIQVRLRLVF
jgi:hypothetical protein